jgi:hypothetical protein
MHGGVINSPFVFQFLRNVLGNCGIHCTGKQNFRIKERLRFIAIMGIISQVLYSGLERRYRCSTFLVYYVRVTDVDNDKMLFVVFRLKTDL